jgi:hypothetical protein
MYRENYIESLRGELVGMVASSLTPVALRYGYSEVPLEANIKWRPQVLVLGNYSSGKSTLINELLGAPIQQTGQAPTDDSFTIITFDETVDPRQGIRVTEEREGKVLLNDPQYPFEALKKHGQRFAAHFRLKRVNSPFLRHLALIDTPGMLDSIAERDRGYNYQEVIGDLAQIADLVLVLFDPHKAGTVREAHASLRDTLPAKTFEDRVIFVLNRIDECATLVDLLRVYGTLCWNLSQMLGRKDIPPIRLTYSQASAGSGAGRPEYLTYLENQRDELTRQIAQAPKYRLDHLADYVETHGERLSHLLEALIAYQRGRRLRRVRQLGVGGLLALLVGGGTYLTLVGVEAFPEHLEMRWVSALLAAVAVLALWALVVAPAAVAAFHRRVLADVDRLTPLDNQTRRDSWAAVKEQVRTVLTRTGGRLAAAEVRADYGKVRKVCEKGSKEIRSALNELSTVRHE